MKTKKELFPLIENAIQQEPLAIFYIDSDISIYNRLCNLAYSKNNEALKYMNINKVDKKLVFEIISREPKKIKDLDNNKDYYAEACKNALNIDGSLIKYICYPNIKENLDSFFELINIAKNNTSDSIDCASVIYALCLDNRKKKESILKNQNKDNLKLLKDIDEEYSGLSNRLIESIDSKTNNSKKIQFAYNSDCPIKSKSKINKNHQSY